MTFIWTKENVNRAQKLWREGHSATYIADAIGCSRNALLGKAYRERERFPSRKGTVRLKRAPRIPAASKKRFKRPKHDAALFRKKLTSKTLMELEDNDCRWPEGERFCGKRKDGRSPYCKAHRPHGLAKGSKT